MLYSVQWGKWEYIDKDRFLKFQMLQYGSKKVNHMETMQVKSILYFTVDEFSSNRGFKVPVVYAGSKIIF